MFTGGRNTAAVRDWPYLLMWVPTVCQWAGRLETQSLGMREKNLQDLRLRGKSCLDKGKNGITAA